MELKIGDLVSHKVHKGILGYGIVLSPSVRYRDMIVCSVQWIQTGYTHNMDIDVLLKVTEDKI